MNSLILDYETMSIDIYCGAIVNLATLQFDEKRFLEDPYEYEELVDRVYFSKFDVQEQAEKYGRTISKDTLNWWKSQPDHVREQIKPTPRDLSLTELHDKIVAAYKGCNKVYSRGYFDIVLTETCLQSTGNQLPWKYWEVIDVRSFIAGMTWGADIKSSFTPPGLKDKFVAHDSRHDVAMDVMRIQHLIRVINE